jgi:hypothetical protein
MCSIVLDHPSHGTFWTLIKVQNASRVQLRKRPFNPLVRFAFAGLVLRLQQSTSRRKPYVNGFQILRRSGWHAIDGISFRPGATCLGCDQDRTTYNCLHCPCMTIDGRCGCMCSSPPRSMLRVSSQRGCKSIKGQANEGCRSKSRAAWHTHAMCWFAQLDTLRLTEKYGRAGRRGGGQPGCLRKGHLNPRCAILLRAIKTWRCG